MTKSLACIICMNDSTEAVVIDDAKKALSEMEKLKEKHKKTIGFLINDLNDYNDIYFWHLHEVPVIQ